MVLSFQNIKEVSLVGIASGEVTTRTTTLRKGQPAVHYPGRVIGANKGKLRLRNWGMYVLKST